MRFCALLFSISVSSANIIVQSYVDNTCGGDGGAFLGVVQADGTDAARASGCIPAGNFGSVNVVSVNPGFQCNIYSDTTCQAFITTVNTVSCLPVIGKGIICFSQTGFDNAFAESTAQLTVGLTKITAEFDTVLPVAAGNLLISAINGACGANGCDPNTKLTREFDDSNCIDPRDCDRIMCAQSVSISGNFDNANERDYMAGLLRQTIELSSSFATRPVDNRAGSLQDVLSFSQIVINDRDGNNQAEMSYSIDVQCSTIEAVGADCGSTLAVVTSTALSLVPEVGGLLAGTFSILCSLSK